MSNYVEKFSDNDDIIRAYDAPINSLKDATVYLAWYGYGSYCGQSLVIFSKAGTLFEVNGSHCSCNGLEGQWEPEETTWAAIAMRKIDGEYDGHEKANEILQKLVKEHLEAK